MWCVYLQQPWCHQHGPSPTYQMEGKLLGMCEAGSLWEHQAFGPSTRGLQQFSQVSGLLGGSASALGLAQMLSQVLL